MKPGVCPHLDRIGTAGPLEYCMTCKTALEPAVCDVMKRPLPSADEHMIDRWEKHIAHCGRSHEGVLTKGRRPVIVATSMAKGGGPCDECGGYIPKGNGIFKLSNKRWVCKTCAERYEEAKRS